MASQSECSAAGAGGAPPPPLADCRVPVVFVLGGPGSGKGTQCALIVAKYGYTHLSTGDLLRAAVAADDNSDAARQLRDIMQRGELVPQEQMLRLLEEAMRRALAESRGFLIDGYPREVAQAERFEQRVCRCRRVIYLQLSDAVMTERLLLRGQTSGRVDDNADTIQLRLQTFHQATRPVVDHYGDRCTVIDADRPQQDVFADVCAVLDSL